MVFAGERQALKQFEKSTFAKFDIERMFSNTGIVFNRLFITQHHVYSIHFTMNEVLKSIPHIELNKMRKKENDEPCTAQEIKFYKALTGKLNIFGHRLLPKVSLAASRLEPASSTLKSATYVSLMLHLRTSAR